MTTPETKAEAERLLHLVEALLTDHKTDDAAKAEYQMAQDEIAASLQRLSDAKDAEWEWQPIETAPKDRTIDIWFEHRALEENMRWDETLRWSRAGFMSDGSLGRVCFPNDTALFWMRGRPAPPLKHQPGGVKS